MTPQCALLCSLVLALVFAAPASAGISATSTVEVGSGEFDGYWCYTIDFNWDAAQSLSHVSGFVGLDGLVCACDPGLFAFPDPAGTTTGYEDGVECTLEYVGEYLCTGDPSLPDPISGLAAVKFDPDPETCDAGSTGSGSVTFYSLLAPSSATHHTDVMVIKTGQDVVSGDVIGPLPAADCAVGVEDRGWGSVKGAYQR